MSNNPRSVDRHRSAALHEEARRYMPAGVNSPVRAFQSVGGTPVYFKRAEGAWFEDEDGNRYVDLCCSWGALILGHAPAPVLAAVRESAWDGLSFGAPSRRELELAKLVVGRIPSAEKVRFVNSGTEAVMTAVRLARGFTGRDVIVKFEGGYHGHLDAMLVKGGSGLATTGIVSSDGVPENAVRDTAVIPFDDEAAIERVFKKRGDRIAAAIVEPIPANAGLLLQRPEFLKTLQEKCRENGSLLILDEVISGFRVDPGGAAAQFGLEPDLITYGKVIGGGMPVGAVAGRREILDKLAPLGSVYQAGTLSGNPVAMAAGAATLRTLQGEPDAYGKLDRETTRLVGGIRRELKAIDYPVTVVRAGSIFWVVFQESAPRSMDQIDPKGIERYATFHRELLNRGVYFPPSGYEVCFVSTAHDNEAVDRVLDAIGPALREACRA